MTGRTVAHYQILEKLGEGGMGVVYKARDTHLERTVAIKVIRPEAVANVERKRRFVQEARTASALNHPNILHIYDIDQADGVDFMAMEYVAGKTLDQVIGRKGLTLGEALRYAVQIAEALARAHAAGIVHRDLKPANIMVTGEGVVKLLDFGLAKLSEPMDSGESATESLKPHTEEGTIVGTTGYMSPEQAEGRKVDARSDIFSFGSVLYEMMTGRRAFEGKSKLATLSAILRQEPPPMEGVPPEMEKIVARCLRKDLERRIQHMDDVKLALQELKEESDSGAAARPPQPARRRWLGIAAAVAAPVIAAAAWWLLRTDSAPAPPLTAVPLTSYPGVEGSPSLSPDGNQVAFSWNGEKRDNYDIYVKLIGPGTPLRLTSNPAIESSPTWSPDGRWIAFLRDLGKGRAGLFLIPALGGPERKLLEIDFPRGWRMISWHPDGNWLAFADRDPPGALPAVFAVSVSSGQRRRLTTPPTPSNGDAHPAFSPDGRALAFCRRTASDEGDLFVVRLSGAMEPQGEPRRLTFDQRATSTPAWTPDGRDILYANGSPNNFSLWRIRVPGPGGAPGKPERLPIGQDGFYPTLSRQGGRLVYVRYWRDLDIWRAQIPGGAAAPFISSTRSEEDPKFSSDGRRIAFRSNRSGSDEIWVCDSDSSNAAQLTAFAGPTVADLNWSPDGRRIAFKSTTRGPGDIYAIDSEGGTPRRLTTEPSDDLHPSWSRDGQWIYFASNRSGTDQVWKMPAGGGAAVQVTRQGGFYSQESPDGRFLYYGKGREPTTGVWRMPVAGGEETRVLEAVAWWKSFQVVDDGIYFMAAGRQPSIQFLRFATGKIEPAVTIGKPSAAGLTVSPDGRTILFTVYEQGGEDLMLVENFR